MALIALIRNVGLERRAAAGRPRRAGHLRRLAVLRRRDDHAGDLGAVGGRGDRGRRAVARRARRADRARDPDRAVRRPALRDRRGRPPVRPGDGDLVHGPRGRSGCTRWSRSPRSCARSRRRYGISFLVRARPRRVHRARLRRARGHGAEALYADMGHFGRAPIRRAWFAAVFPALVLNYMGQGALLLRDPEAIENPFFLLVPDWARIPMVVLATVATVIASQAVISGAFSVTRQAVQLGFLPRLHDPPHLAARPARSTCRRSTGGSSSRSSRSWSGSARRSTSRRPTGSRSPARWRSTPSCSSSSCACCGRSRPGSRSRAAGSSCSSTWPSSPRTSRRCSTAAGSRS